MIGRPAVAVQGDRHVRLDWPHLLVAVFTVALLVATSQPVVLANEARCSGLPDFESALLATGQRWLESTSQAGVSFTANPLEFGATEWAIFAELAEAKRDALEEIVPPPWLASWLALQIEGATLQARAGHAAASDGLPALTAFGAQFFDLVLRDEQTTAAAIGHCPAFARVAATWNSLDRDFEPASATPTAMLRRIEHPFPLRAAAQA